ncbi:SDR family NAD(P)-dependent oxidoreductase [Actinoalloteichus hymeniacidonis]|uniref:Enoyl-(Acyl-carrier-protein) reductase (NADH) n=1 Tax=Actinoalloteichus hymeniacidonis TaxID=340345 RepID=A0AAC9HTD9_9PSEU|nr:SDR family oxidoreductase [Actinoalloteichus hymeniacidonis]AOS64989.1 Enoyl-(acyl-carrier-protein) reductase (NADH) [Actinoalloteichus hymeniacidonis]MBB5906935.1 NAD(P)-dependent dehydrogenase (short-subunit alcohol dehydrogenase family) [Actinoalloteichus hymeniacidonis]
MLLENKIAVLYGAGSISRAAATAFAKEGAAVFVASRTEARATDIAGEIRAAGGRAEATQLDALDEQAVDAFVDDVVERMGRVDISFNVIGYGDVQQPLTEISVDDFLSPIVTATRTQFLTTRAAARHMIPQRSGVILAFGGSGPQTMPGLGGFKIALDAVEGVRRQWAVELGEHGIRVVTLVSGGIPEGIAADDALRGAIEAGIAESSLLKRAATLAEVGNAAAFVASDRAGAMTSATVNISAGAIVDL